MKNGKRPTVKQKIRINGAGLRWENWLVVKDRPEEMLIVHRHSGQERRISKGE